MEKDTEDPHSIGDVVDGLGDLAEENGEVRFADVLDKFGSRSFAPIMLVLAIVQLSPIGAIPGMPTLLALCILLVAVQLLIGREHIWLPDWIAQRSVSGSKLDSAIEKLDGIATKLDGIAKGRLKFLTRGPALQLAAFVIVLLCIAAPPLEVLPWASAGPMLAIAVISLAIMVRDGLAMLIAWALAAAAMGGAGYYYYSSSGGSGSGILPF